MQSAEFDHFADAYQDTHRRNLRVSGEAPDFFARSKIEILRQRWTKAGRPEPERILDFGCGVGASLGHLATLFPQSAILGLDVSEASLEVAAKSAPKGVDLALYDGVNINLEPSSVDLIFSACVFHHIAPQDRLGLLLQLHTLLKTDGVLMIYEHNPINPVTRYIVATCPFDEHAVLASRGAMVSVQKSAGFKSVHSVFTGFFPGALAALRPLEPALGWAPLGAQYYTFAHA